MAGILAPMRLSNLGRVKASTCTCEPVANIAIVKTGVYLIQCLILQWVKLHKGLSFMCRVKALYV